MEKPNKNNGNNKEFCYIIKEICKFEYLDCPNCNIYHDNRHKAFKIPIIILLQKPEIKLKFTKLDTSLDLKVLEKLGIKPKT